MPGLYASERSVAALPGRGRWQGPFDWFYY